MKRQGDLLIIEISKIPAGAKRVASRTLAEGEVTGHFHRLDQGQVYEKNGHLYFQVGKGMEVTLNHPEHHPLIFTPGRYEVVRQREYEPGGWRHVAD